MSTNRVVSRIQLLDREIASNVALQEKIAALNPTEYRQMTDEEHHTSVELIESTKGNLLSDEEVESFLSYLGSSAIVFNESSLTIKYVLLVSLLELLLIRDLSKSLTGIFSHK